MSASTLKADVTIVGAGLVGLSAAVAMRKAGYEVVLVDDQEHPQTYTQLQNDADWDQRIYAISPKNVQWLASLGAWQLLDVSRIGEMQVMEIWGDATDAPLTLSAEDVNADDLGFIVEERALKNALLQQVQAYDVRTLFGCKCIKLIADISQATLHLDNQQVIESKLLIAADGVNSWVRMQLGIGVQAKEYHQTAVVANFMTEKSHGNIARQWFKLGEDGHCSILAWLPLPENKISIVWSAPTQSADALLQFDADEFTNQVMQAGDSVLGKLTMITKPAAFPLVLKKAETLAVNSVVLVGDAAHRIHPMAGQGVNLGFRDVIDLLEIIANKHQYQPINDISLLKCYMRVRKADLLKMLTLTNGLYHLFENQNSVVQKIRNWGLAVTNQQPIKKILVKNAIAL
jgi:ubiquinone biosynthesis UbiH/UbiF/VisC/COQ6 family hydroxylase